MKKLTGTPMFKDAVFEQLIRNILHKSTNEITSEDMASIKQITTVTSNDEIYLINDITGIEYCVNLEFLEVNYPLTNKILGGLNGLENLKKLKKIFILDYEQIIPCYFSKPDVIKKILKRYKFYKLPTEPSILWTSVRGDTKLYNDFKENLKKLALKGGEEITLELYTNFKLAELGKFAIYNKYSKIFGLCLFLGLTDLYDIGCGVNFQVCLITGFQGIYYTGIDCDKGENGIDFKCQNKWFVNYTKRINFIHAEYPFEIKAKNNNIAIAVGGVFEYEDSQVEKTATALARDFERIFVDLSLKSYEIFKNSLPDFKIHVVKKYDNYVIIFATKFHEEIALLEETGYNYNDDRFSLEEVDLTRYIDKLMEIAIKNN